jgi:hypothetical protein
MISITSLGRWAATALLTVGVAGAGFAQEQGQGGDKALEELKKALEQMRSSEELLAQSSREKAAVAQDEVDKILRKLLDDVELNQSGAAQKMLLGSEKASIKIDEHIQKVIDMAKFSQGQPGSGMEPKGQPQSGKPGEKSGETRGKDKDQGQKKQDQQAGQKPGEKPGQKPGEKPGQQQSGQQPGDSQADRAYEAKTGKGRPPEVEEDPNAWKANLPAKFQEDALKEAPASWPGKYENLIRRWQKTLARLPARR